MKKSSVIEWHTQFKEAQESMEDTERSGYLKTHRCNKNVEKYRICLLDKTWLVI